MDKRMIRKEAAARLQAMSAEERDLASGKIADQVLQLEAFRQAETIMAFWSMPTEPGTPRIIQSALAQGKRVLLPRCFEPPRMEALPYDGNPDHLRPGRWDIPEPVPAGAEREKVILPDLILVPCAAATKEGVRLGHGGGYYDWFLKDQPGRKVCLCFRTQLMEALPETSTDIRMDQVLWA